MYFISLNYIFTRLEMYAQAVYVLCVYVPYFMYTYGHCLT